MQLPTGSILILKRRYYVMQGQQNNELDQMMDDIKRIFSNAKRQQQSRGGGGGGGGFGGFGRDFGGLGGFGLIAALALIVFLASDSFYTIDSKKGEKGVLVRFGRYVATVDPGPHFKIPFIDQVYKIRVQEVRKLEFGYRQAQQFGGASLAELEQESLMLTGDLNIAQVRWTVHYTVGDPKDFVFRFRPDDLVETLRDVSVSVMRRVVGDKSVDEVLTVGKTAVVNQAKTLTQEIVDGYRMGVIITTIKLKDVLPPPVVQPAFNDVNTAKQAQEQAINNAEREYNRVIPEARGLAERRIADARGYAVDVINRAKGDSARFKSMLAEYKKAPVITRKRLYLDTMEDIYNGTQNFTIVDDKVKGLLPMFLGGGQQGGIAAGGSAPVPGTHKPTTPPQASRNQALSMKP